MQDDGSSGPGQEIKSLIRDIPLIERYARNNESDDFRFREFLKIRINMSTVQVDDITQATTDEVWRNIDCTTCANCCKRLPVVVDNEDIKRLSSRLGVSRQQFMDKYVSKGPDGDKQFNSTPCPFLGKDNLCGVYEDRPVACQDYPYLYKKHFTSRSLTMIGNNAVCPIVFNVWQELKTRLGFRRTKKTL